MRGVYNPPPNWPYPPPGWRPSPGWSPDAAWGAPPPGWRLWLPANPKAAQHTAFAAATVAATWLVLLVATGDLSWDDIPRLLLLFTALPAGITYLLSRRSSSRWRLRRYLAVAVGLNLVVLIVTPFVEVFLLS